MVAYSYNVRERGERDWHWELIGPDGEVLASGSAETRAKAVAHAMIAGLERRDVEGRAKNDDPGGVHH
jgi:hypothetical protein